MREEENKSQDCTTPQVTLKREEKRETKMKTIYHSTMARK